MGRSTRRAGLAGIEFALVSPVLLSLFLGTIDISGALLTARRMTVAAGSVAEIASTASVQSVALNKLTDVQAWQATTAPFALFPAWTYPNAPQTFSITVSAVSFTASSPGCSQNCSYSARVMWSVANKLGKPQLRACGGLALAPDTNAPSYSTMPVGNSGPTSLFVADISYTFHPLFFGFLIGDIPMMQSAFISPRIYNRTDLVVTGDGGVSVNNCVLPS